MAAKHYGPGGHGIDERKRLAKEAQANRELANCFGVSSIKDRNMGFRDTLQAAVTLTCIARPYVESASRAASSTTTPESLRPATKYRLTMTRPLLLLSRERNTLARRKSLMLWTSSRAVVRLSRGSPWEQCQSPHMLLVLVLDCDRTG